MNPSVDFSKLPLRDIHLPAPVGWWPPAPGWWLLAALVLAAGAYAGLHYYRRRNRRAVLRTLASLAAALEAGEEPVRCLQRLSTVLRRYAMTVGGGPRAGGVPGLAGRRWLEYLDARWHREAFTREGWLLVEAPYAPTEAVSREQADVLLRLAGEWVRAQRAGR